MCDAMHAHCTHGLLSFALTGTGIVALKCEHVMFRSRTAETPMHISAQLLHLSVSFGWDDSRANPATASVITLQVISLTCSSFTRVSKAMPLQMLMIPINVVPPC